MRDTDQESTLENQTLTDIADENKLPPMSVDYKMLGPLPQTIMPSDYAPGNIPGTDYDPEKSLQSFLSEKSDSTEDTSTLTGISDEFKNTELGAQAIRALGNHPMSALDNSVTQFAADAGQPVSEKNILQNPFNLKNTPSTAVPPPGWNPKTDARNFAGVNDENQAYLLEATSPDDQQFRYNRILAQQQLDSELQNASFVSKAIGFGLGFAVDAVVGGPILRAAGDAAAPIVGAISKAIPNLPEISILSKFNTIAATSRTGKISTDFISGVAGSLGPSAAWALPNAALGQLNDVNGNMHDFFIDSAIDTVFGAVLFGAGGAAISAADKMELWGLRKTMKATNQGLDMKLKVGENGEIIGYEPYIQDKEVFAQTFNEDPETLDLQGVSGGAMAVKTARDIADSAFAKSGFFKIPYIGDATLSFLSNRFTGSPILRMQTARSQIMNAIASRVADTNIYTKGSQSGITKENTVETHLKLTRSDIKTIGTLANALFAEHNGIKLNNRMIQSGAVLAKALKNRFTELGGTDYTDRETFNKRVLHAWSTGEADESSQVNSAAELYKKTTDQYFKAYREAKGYGEDYQIPRGAKEYVMRVYNTPKMSNNKVDWNTRISQYLEKSDDVIEQRMKPVYDIDSKIESLQDELKGIDSVNRKLDSRQKKLDMLKIQRRTLTNKISNDIRTTDLSYHADDWSNLSADEATHLESILKPYNDSKDEYEKAEKEYSDLNDKLQKSDQNESDPLKKINKEKKLLQDSKRDLNNKINSLKKKIKNAQDPTLADIFFPHEITEYREAISRHEKDIKKYDKKINSLKEKIKETKSPSELNSSLEESNKKLSIAFEKFHSAEARLGSTDIPRNYYEFSSDYTGFSHDVGTINFKDTKKLLKFRKTYYEESHKNSVTEYENSGPEYKYRGREDKNYQGSDKDAHSIRLTDSNAAYDTILQQTPEETINQMMGKVTGNRSENALKQRTLMVPDSVLREGGFLSNDPQRMVANYMMYFGRRTAFHTAFDGFIFAGEGGPEELWSKLKDEFDKNQYPLHRRKYELDQKLQEGVLDEEKKPIQDMIKKISKRIAANEKEFKINKEDAAQLYKKVMGIADTSGPWSQRISSGSMAWSVITQLGFLPVSQMWDHSAIGLMHGSMQFLKAGLHPMLNNFFTLGKGADGEAYRETAKHIGYGLADVSGGVAQQIFHDETNPYVNMGRFVDGLEKVAHATSIISLSAMMDNHLQKIAGSTIQSKMMQVMLDYVNGTAKKNDVLYLKHYGLYPYVWAERFVNEFKARGATSPITGGLNSRFWTWDDKEASNAFSDAIFRGVDAAVITKGIADSPFWMDRGLGAIIRGFSGWTYASVQRFMIPFLQQPDAKSFAGLTFMLGMGYLQSPMRRWARGDDAFPQDQSAEERAFEVFQDSGIFSYVGNMVWWMNTLTDNRLLGNIGSDRFHERTVSGALADRLEPVGVKSVVSVIDLLNAFSEGNMNKVDMKKAARMIPGINSPWIYWYSRKVADAANIPDTRAEAKALNNE